MSSTKDQIISNAAKGMSQVQIARMLGVDESYVSQVVNSDDGKQQIEEMAAQISAETSKFDEMLDDAESVALNRIKSRLGMANFQQSLAAFKVLNSANRRRDTSPAARPQVGAIHTVMLPQIAITQFLMNSKSEIVEVEGRTMISANAAQLPSILKQRTGRDLVLESAESKQETPVRAERATALLSSMETARPRAKKSTADLDITDLL